MSFKPQKGMYERVQDLKKINPNLKVTLAVGGINSNFFSFLNGWILMLKLKGWNHGSAKFSDMTDNEYLRSNFVKTSVEFLKAHGFDGLGNK